MSDKINNIQIADFNYTLTDDRIAKYPLKNRDSSKLLVYNRGSITDDTFSSLPTYLDKDYLMIFNNTKVIHARLHFRKSTGALIEILLLEPYQPCDYVQIFQTAGCCQWECIVGNLKKWKSGVLEQKISISHDEREHSQCYTDTTLSAELHTTEDGRLIVTLKWDNHDITFAQLLQQIGQLPIPPYLNRPTEESDNKNYQTTYSKIEGSVAAPTAGLHFTPAVLNDIDSHHILRQELTLHVGAGTFRPVKTQYIHDHSMHKETFFVSHSLVKNLIAKHGNTIAVGTTSVRTIESLYYIGVDIAQKQIPTSSHFHISQWQPYNDALTGMREECLTPLEALQYIDEYMTQNNLSQIEGDTQIMIVPGYKFHFVKQLITNFHQPQSTLLLLISAFVGDNWQTIYAHALQNDYRFLSYGDSSLLIP